jgi:hypothetical protein
VLNRIYIIVGTLAIIVLAGAFIAPYFISWSDYRGRMEELATAMLGTPVTVRGDIEFSLLPQPRLRFADVLVGSTEAPAATVDNVEAEFALIDFLRDDYTITRLVLRQPVIDFAVDESGLFGSGVTVATGTDGISLGQTTVVDATVRLMDRRSGENFVAEKVTGDLRLSNFSGPFSFAGTAEYRDAVYSLRINASAPDAAGNARLSAFLQPQSGRFSFSAEGALQAGMAPKFDGDLVFRQAPPAAQAAEDIRGDMVLEAKVAGSTDRIVFSNYTLRPDENRAGTRLTGAASIQLGMRRSFDAVVSGGVMSLPPRDAKEDASILPYEAVRLLSELPAPIVPPIAGRIGIDLAEVGLRGFSLRNLRVDATTDGRVWSIEQLIGELPGDTELRLKGTLAAEADRPTLRGELNVRSERLDALAALWRKPGDNTPLFNLPGQLTGQVMLAGDALGLSNGVLTLDQTSHAVEARLGFGDERRLDLVGHFDQLGTAGSAALAALLPDSAGDAAFANSFPTGSFALSAESARLLDLDGEGLVAEGQWGAGQLSFSRLSAADWGGVGVDTTLALSGSAAQPSVSGEGMVRIVEGEAPALQRLYDLASLPVSWRTYLGGSSPADLLVNVSVPVEGAQTVTLNGAVGAGELNLRAELSSGLAGLTSAPLRVTGALESTDVTGLSQQLGLGPAGLFAGEGSMLVSFGVEGVPNDALISHITASLGEESVSFAGRLQPGDNGAIDGEGTLDVRLDDAGALARVIGADGLSLPAANGSAQLAFKGTEVAELTEISGTSSETAFSGALTLSRTGSTGSVTGAMEVDRVSAEGLAATLFGPAALVAGDGVWPEGPLADTGEARRTRGAVTVASGALSAGGTDKFGATWFELNWDETRTRIVDLTAAAGEGSIALDMAVCCAGPLETRTLSGRLSVNALPVETIAPGAVSAALDGTISGGMSFEGTGASLAEALGSAAGEGTVSLTGFSVEQLSPDVYPAVAGFEDVLNMEPDAMTALMSLALGQDTFSAPAATGAFTLAGGVVRLANFIVEGEGANLSGSLSLALETLKLDGSFTMTPAGFEDPSGLVGPDTSRVIARLAGTLLAPQVEVDLDEMVAAILVRANELEVDRLELLQAEDAARQRAAAEERNRLIEAQRKRAAEEAARLAAEEAAREAAEAARRLEQQQLEQEQQPVSPSFEVLPESSAAPFTFELPPPQVNQSIGSGVNQPPF